MGSWIDKEAEKFHDKKEEQIRREELLSSANHWAMLRHQVEHDVGEINSHTVWKDILGGIPLVIQNVTDGFQIQKTTYPTVFVTVRHRDRQVEVSTEIKETGQSVKNAGETLFIDVEDDQVVLRRNGHHYGIPRDASKHILSPIIKALTK